MKLGSEEQEIEIFRHAYDRCLGLTCPVCMTECRLFAYLAISLIKLRSGEITEEELEKDEMFEQAIKYLKAFYDAHKDLVNKVLNKGEFVLDGIFVEEEVKEQ